MTQGNRTRSRSVLVKVVVALFAIALLAASCGGKSLDESKKEKRGEDPLTSDAESHLPAEAKPKRGGKLTYGLEAETGGGFCLIESQLDIYGIIVSMVFY